MRVVQDTSRKMIWSFTLVALSFFPFFSPWAIAAAIAASTGAKRCA